MKTNKSNMKINKSDRKNKREYAGERSGARAPEKRERSVRAERPERKERQAQPARKQAEFHTEELPEGLLIGRNPVMEALKSGRGITKLMVLRDAEGSVKKILGMAHDKNIPVQTVERAVLDRAAYGGPHQGVVAHVSDYEYSEVSDIVELVAERN